MITQAMCGNGDHDSVAIRIRSHCRIVRAGGYNGDHPRPPPRGEGDDPVPQKARITSAPPQLCGTALGHHQQGITYAWTDKASLERQSLIVLEVMKGTFEMQNDTLVNHPATASFPTCHTFFPREATPLPPPFSGCHGTSSGNSGLQKVTRVFCTMIKAARRARTA